MAVLGSLLFFIIGCVCGFFVKSGFDYYHDFILEQKKTTQTMHEVMAKWDLINEMKEKEKGTS